MAGRRVSPVSPPEVWKEAPGVLCEPAALVARTPLSNLGHLQLVHVDLDGHISWSVVGALFGIITHMSPGKVRQ